jgi:hypothetical protein
MLRQIVLLLISFSCTSQSAPASHDNHPPPYVDSDAYEVYSAILPSEWPVRVAHAKMLVIRSETNGYEMCLHPEKDSEDMIGSAIAEYVELNKKPLVLQRNLSVAIPYELITFKDLKSAIEQGGWEGFYKKYPDSGGWIELSAVGFNAEKTVAVVYMGHSCGGLCGGGQFHVLQKKEGTWVPLNWKGSSCAWAS